MLARIAAERVSPGLGQPLIVENRAGAGGNIAGEMAARTEADGYTLLVAGQAILAINKALYKKLSYDPATDFAFVGMLGVIANVLLVNPKTVPVNSLGELIALAKKKPGDISYGSNGPGSLTHLTTAILAHQAGAEFLHVPYQGAAPLMTDLLAGRIGMTFTAASAALPLVQSGQLRALAVTTGQRSRFSPDIPTLVESGFPSLDAPTWFGVVVRTPTPAAILAQAARRIQCGDRKRRLLESAGKKFHGGHAGSAGRVGSVSRQGAQALVRRRVGNWCRAGLMLSAPLIRDEGGCGDARQRIVANRTASAQARSNSSRSIHSSTVCASFWPAPKVTVGMPWRTIQFASSPPLTVRMFGAPPPAAIAAAARFTTGRLSFMRNG